MNIQNHHPHTEFTFDSNGNLVTIDAKNFPGTGSQCQGKLETKAYEDALIEAEFIQPISSGDREMKQQKLQQSNQQTNQHPRRLSF